MIDVLEAAKAFLGGLGYQAAFRRLDRLTGKEGIVIRDVNMLPVEHFMSCEETYGYYFQVIVRRRSEEEARNICWSIAEAFDGTFLESPSGCYCVYMGCEIYTWPQELNLDEAGFYAWETKICAFISRNR